MEIDFSKIFYDLYFSRSNRLIEVTTKSGRKIQGVFISFFHGDRTCNEPFIRKWYIVEEKYKMSTGLDAFGFRLGELIRQEDISSILFLEDNSQLQFN